MELRRSGNDPGGGLPRPDGGSSGAGHGRAWAVVLAFGMMGGLIGFLPLSGDFHAAEGLDLGMLRVGLAIFVGVAILWMTEALPLSGTALLIPLLMVLSGISDVKGALVSFADPLIFLFLGGFALAAALSRQGLDRWLATKIVRVGGGEFIRVCCGLFVVTASLSMWMSNTATVVLMIPLAMGILRRMEREGDVGNRTFLLLGLAYAASIGGLGLVVGSPPNGIAAAQLGISFAQWAVFGVPTVFALLPVMIGVLYLICRPGKGQKVTVESEVLVFDRRRVLTMAVFGATALAWVFGGELGALIGITSGMDTLVALGAIAALLLCRMVTWSEIDGATDWGVLVLFGGGIALSGILKDTGVSLFLARLVTAAVADWPIMWVIAGLVTVVIFLTELCSNTAVAALFVPLFASVAEEMGIPAAQLVLPLAMAASCAFMMPVGTPPNALVYATGQVSQGTMMRIGIVLNLLFVVLLVVVAGVLF